MAARLAFARRPANGVEESVMRCTARLTAARVGLAVVAFAVLLVFSATQPSSTSAQPEADTEYSGALTDGGTATIVVNDARSTAQASFQWRRPEIGCPSSVVFDNVPLDV